MKLSDYFNAQCDQHELKSICVSHDRYGVGITYHAYAHWNGEPSGKCASGYGDTPEEAIAKAVAEANALRGRGVMIPDALEVEPTGFPPLPTGKPPHGVYG